MSNYSVYWIRSGIHTNYFTDGYVGISSDLTSRLASHKRKAPNQHMQNAINKYGWANLVISLIASGVDKELACFIELELRPNGQTGWNLAPGGGLPPSNRGKSHLSNTKDKISKSLKEAYRTSAGHSGDLARNFKGTTVATSIKDGSKIYLLGNADMREYGFIVSCISRCINNKQKSHKGFTFKKETQ